MRLKQKTNTKKIVIAVFVIIAIVVCALVWVLFYKNEAPKNNINVQNKPGSQNSASDESVKPAPTDGTGSDKPQAPEESNSPEKTTVTPIVTGYNLTSDGRYLQIDGGVNSIVEGGGNCKFSVSWSGGSATVSSEATSAPSSTDCRTARLLVSELPTDTQMSIDVIYESDRYFGKSNNRPTFKKEELR